eukprot:tig00020800_g13729.t1
MSKMRALAWGHIPHRNLVRGVSSSSGGAANGGLDPAVSKSASAVSFIDPRFVGGLVLIGIGGVVDHIFVVRGLLDTKREKDLEKIAEAVKDVGVKIDKQSERIDKQSERIDKQSERFDKQSERFDKQSERIDRILDLLAGGCGGRPSHDDGGGGARA